MACLLWMNSIPLYGKLVLMLHASVECAASMLAARGVRSDTGTGLVLLWLGIVRYVTRPSTCRSRRRGTASSGGAWATAVVRLQCSHTGTGAVGSSGPVTHVLYHRPVLGFLKSCQWWFQMCFASQHPWVMGTQHSTVSNKSFSPPVHLW